MSWKMAWIAVASLTVSAVCLTSAAWIAGSNPLRGDIGWSVLWQDDCAAPPGDAGNRPGEATLPWAGGHTFVIDIPANVRYRPGPTAEVIVSGNPALVPHVRLRGSRLQWDDDLDCDPVGRLVVDVTGPPITDWKLNGVGALEMSAVDQQALSIDIDGSADVVGEGRVEELSLDISGSGGVDLHALAARRMMVRIRGNGDADIAPQETADISITGRGTVRLHSEPARLHTQVSGSGTVKHVGNK